MTAEIAGAHLSNNAVASGDVPTLIQTVFDSLATLANPEQRAPAAPTPAVPIRRSVTDDYIACLENGKKLKLLKRHRPGGRDFLYCDIEFLRVQWIADARSPLTDRGRSFSGIRSVHGLCMINFAQPPDFATLPPLPPR